ncbi:sulfite exporter TauE/SafE family protein [Myxococcus sp. RHSTA-1-4]|uniref:sulfite exporter TauE/SafE family protein n=1 Tax=Myxococcus sp. RHSTA-1-4 TaxID=2874601 RepID=UPI001CC12064|nr:sulfite exporter TauE/SafE family protein [Myxococcus sp. RHSTA-1-4]MBZ4416924.1 sulfite exporter TauE/SafE family protein [Myxococcus sp. RHSTA-1-4]
MALETIAISPLLAALPPSPAVAAGALGALTVGLTGSVHCLLMCGPLACAGLPAVPGPERRRAVLAYQGARVASYALVGGALGAIGGGVTQALAVSTRPYLPWLMAAALVASALELGKRLRPLPGLSQVARAISRWGAKFSWTGRAGAMGAVTPLLPCGLLYGVFAAALASGSFAGGALVLGAFALGGLPALLGAQLQVGLWKHRPRAVSFLLQRAVPLAAAAILIYRAVGSSGGQPSCH